MDWRLRVALVQVGRLGLEGLERAAEIAASAGKADLYVFPENWLSREPLEASVVDEAARRLASLLGSTVVAGLHYIRDPGGTRSAAVAASPDGRVWRVCEKIHPSKSTGERGLIKPGRLINPFTVKGVGVGCVACVDIFYPEIARALMVRGADVVLNPASIPSNRLTLWHSTLIARAAENAVFVVGVNVTGTKYPDGRETAGGSIAASPEGEPVVVLGRRQGSVAVELEGWEVAEVEERRGFRALVKEKYLTLYAQL